MTESLENQFAEESSGGLPWGKIMAFALLALLLAVTAFGLVRAQKGPVNIGERAPDFKLTTFDGRQISSESLRGQVVVLNIWASWCKPCEQEARELEQIYKEYKDQGVIFLGAAYADTERESLAYLERFEITYPNGPDLGTEIYHDFRARGVPETYIIGPDGVLVGRKIGPYTSLTEIRGAVEAALQSSLDG
jgi:cytochrome c biogenesis protein CcmG/thiol:disulfide interchange protein DsbE